MTKILMPAVLMSVAGTALAQTYQITPVPFPPGATMAAGRGVNNNGHVTGWCQLGGTTHAFIYTPTAGSSDIADMGFSNTDYGGYAINDSDVIVGEYPVSNALHAFRWDGSLHDITIDMTNGSSNPTGYAVAINAVGDIGGTLRFHCIGAANNLTGAHWTPGGASVTSLGAYDLCSASSVLGTNNVGDLAGWGLRVIGGLNWYRATIWRGGTTIELPNFGTSPGHARVNSINDSGVAVGMAESRTPATWTAPSLWTAAGALENLNTAADPTYIGEAKAINNAGLIVGTSGAAPTLWTAPGVKFALIDRVVPPPPAPGIALSDAVSISDTGFVLCNGTVPNSPIGQRAYLLSPCTPALTTQPAPTTVSTMTSVTFSVAAVGAGPIAYHWRKGGVALSNGLAAGGGAITGATTASLSITPAACPDGGVYDCVITSPCGSVNSGAAALTLTGCTCTADFNNDGDSGTDADIEAFFQCLAGSCCVPCALPDFNGDGDTATDADIESFFRILGGGVC